MVRAVLVCAGLLWVQGAQAQLRVVVTSKPVHSLVAAVMDGVGTPQLLISGSASPHTYAMRPSDAKALAGADVFFRVSEELEPFTGRLVAALPASVQVVTLQDAPGLQLLRLRYAAFDTEEGGTARGMHDPHIWLDPANAKAMVGYIAGVLAKRAPAHAARLWSNAAEAERLIDLLHGELERELRPLAGRPVLVFHDAYQYLERRYGLTVLGSLTLAPGVHGGAKRLSELRAKVAQSGATCVLAEPHFEPKLATAVTEGLTTRLGALDPEGALISPGPQLYFTLMRGLADSLKRCLS